MKETHLRSVVKSISWRIIATLTTIVLVFIFTGSFSLSLGIGCFDVAAKTVFYYLHERAWNSISFGKMGA